VRPSKFHKKGAAIVALLEVKNVSAYYGNIQALKGVSITVEKGEIVSLIGGNGAGKTTTLRTISGLLKPRSGSVLFDGEDLSAYKAHELVPKGMAMVPEGRGIFAKLTVLDNLEMGAYHRSDKDGIAQDMEYVFGLFPRLMERQKQIAGTMSGGEQQMLATARALMSKPSLILMDEPSMGLAPVLVETIFDTIVEINKAGTTVLLVEQNAHMALQVAHRGYVLQTGEIVVSDSADALRNDPMVQKAYLGIE
jgi:branched-chain amino acid transport system ATP-binding protein